MQQNEAGVLLPVRVMAGKKANQCVGFSDENELVLKIRAPALKGAANRELITYLSELLQVPKQGIILLKGATCKHKLLLIEGITIEQILHRTALA